MLEGTGPKNGQRVPFRRAATMDSSKKRKLTYRDAGLDLDLYEQSLASMPPLLKRTHTPRVLDGFGGFASLFSLDYNSRLFAKNYRHPVLVACTDGVGSKLKIAAMTGRQSRGSGPLGSQKGGHENGEEQEV